MNPNESLKPFSDDDGPVFDEPWHAQVLALADSLVQGGHFSAAEWAEALGAARARAEARRDPDTVESYYLCAIEALEELLAAKGGISPKSLAERKKAWEAAYLSTQHGKPVILDKGTY